MTKQHTDRGKTTERLLVTALRELGWPHAERTVRTGYRHDARELPDCGDVDGTPGIVWQAKALHDRRADRSSTAAAEAAVAEWLAETEQQRRAAHATVGVLVVRRQQYPAARWWAFTTLRTLYGLADGFTGHLAERIPGSAQLAPARFELADLALVLRAYGFGTPLPAELVAVP